MSNKPKLKLKVRGAAVFPKTDRAVRWDDAANRSVADPDGKFECSVAVDAPTGESIRKQLLAFAKEAGVKNPQVPVKMETDKEGEETGRMVIKATQYGKDQDGRIRVIPHFDSKARPLSKDFKLTSGSEVIMAVYAKSWKKGVSLVIDAIQVIKYVEPQMDNPFSAVDGGFEYEGNEEANPFVENEAEDSGEEDNSTDF